MPQMADWACFWSWIQADSGSIPGSPWGWMVPMQAHGQPHLMIMLVVIMMIVMMMIMMVMVVISGPWG